MHKKNKEQEEDYMNFEQKTKRPCSVSESIIESCREVKEMRRGNIPKGSLDELFSNIEKWRKE